MVTNQEPEHLVLIKERIVEAFKFSSVQSIVEKKLRKRVIITGILRSGKKTCCSIDYSGEGLPRITCTHIILEPFFGLWYWCPRPRLIGATSSSRFVRTRTGRFKKRF